MWENWLILKTMERVMNFEIPSCDVLTRRFVIKSTEGARTTTVHPTGDGGSRDMVENRWWPYDNRGRIRPKFPDICLTVEGKPWKKPQPGNWSDRGSNPTLAWEVRTLPLDHSSGRIWTWLGVSYSYNIFHDSYRYFMLRCLVRSVHSKVLLSVYYEYIHSHIPYGTLLLGQSSFSFRSI